jgi:hypothetical protein
MTRRAQAEMAMVYLEIRKHPCDLPVDKDHFHLEVEDGKPDCQVVDDVLVILFGIPQRRLRFLPVGDVDSDGDAVGGGLYTVKRRK